MGGKKSFIGHRMVSKKTPEPTVLVKLGAPSRRRRRCRQLHVRRYRPNVPHIDVEKFSGTREEKASCCCCGTVIVVVGVIRVVAVVVVDLLY